jgi:hypothetical protein
MRHVQEMSLRLQALVYTAETNSEELHHMSQRNKCILREMYFALLTPESALIVMVTWLRIREVTSSNLGLELVIMLEDAKWNCVIFDVEDRLGLGEVLTTPHLKKLPCYETLYRASDLD